MTANTLMTAADQATPARRALRDVVRQGLAVAMMALLVSHAEAATLRTDVVLTGPHLTVGDLFDGVTRHADYALAPAPAAGKSMTIPARDLQRVADTFGLQWRAATGFEQATVRSAQEILTRADITTLLEEAVAGKDMELQLTTSLPALSVPAGMEAAVTIEDLVIDRSRQSFTARIVLPTAAGAERVETLSGRAYQMVRVPVLKSALRAGDLIGAADLEHIRVRQAALPGDTLIDESRLVGMAVRRGATVGQPLQANDVEAPVMVRKGQGVTVTLRNGAVALTLQGRAMQNGSAGDTIRILNNASNRVIEGVVTGFQTADVQPPSAALLN